MTAIFVSKNGAQYRLLQQAHDEGIVRITVFEPSGIYSDIETNLEKRFHLKEAVVVEATNLNHNPQLHAKLVQRLQVILLVPSKQMILSGSRGVLR